MTTLKNHIFSISQEPQEEKEPDQQEPDRKGVSAGSDEKPVAPADVENNEGNDKQDEKAKAKHALEIKQAQVRLPGDGRVEKVIKLVLYTYRWWYTALTVPACAHALFMDKCDYWFSTIFELKYNIRACYICTVLHG